MLQFSSCTAADDWKLYFTIKTKFPLAFARYSFFLESSHINVLGIHRSYPLLRTLNLQF